MSNVRLSGLEETDLQAHHGGAILLVKIGSHPKLTEIVPRLQQLLPLTKFYGIGVPGIRAVRNYETVATEDQLLLGAFDAWWQRQLFVDPALYSKVLPHEGQLLRMTQRVIDHDIFSIKHPKFPTENDFSSFEGRRQLLLRQVAFWDFILREHRISAVVSQNLPHNFWDAVLHIVAQAREVPYLCFHEVRPFIGSLYIYEHPSQMGNLEIGRSLIDTMRQKNQLLENSSSRRHQLLSQVSPVDLQRTRVDGARKRSTLKSRLGKQSPSYRHVVPRIIRSIRRRIKQSKSHRETKQLQLSGHIPDKYFLIELQPPSNATSLTKGFMYGDARELIAHIAHNLPSGYSLVVTESSRAHMKNHPRRENFWRQVIALPSVVLMSTDTETGSLLTNCAGLIEVGYSTLAIQALWSEVPVILLGESHLPELPGLWRVAVQDDLGRILESIVDSGRNSPISSQEFTSAIAEWCQQIQSSTLEGALSSFPRDVPDRDEYQERIVGNVSSLIATWYEGVMASNRE